jgi:DNA-binding YbaB/EbfC family protein
MFDMMKMMGKMKEAQERMKQAQENLGRMQTTAAAGEGKVKAIVNGKKQLIALEIDPSLTDAPEIARLVVEAVQSAQNSADVMAREELKKSTQGLLPNIPGMDLGNLMG